MKKVQCEYDAAFIADVPNIESMPAIALAVVAGGASKLGSQLRCSAAGRSGGFEEASKGQQGLQTRTLERIALGKGKACALPRAISGRKV